MSVKKFKLAKSGQVTKCPKCGNDTTFIAHSEQFCVDACEIWVKCECEYDPTELKIGYRYEDIWGGITKDTVAMALQCWDDALAL